MERFTEHHKDQVLAIVSYYMDMELRGKIMQEAPEAYNRWFGSQILKVDVRPGVKIPPSIESHDEYCARMERESVEDCKHSMSDGS